MRLFTDFLRDIRSGFVVTQASEALVEVVAAVRETGKTGKLVLTITLKPEADSRQTNVLCDVKTTIPRRSIVPSIFFASDEGELLRSDPDQKDMGFERVEFQRKEAK